MSETARQQEFSDVHLQGAKLVGSPSRGDFQYVPLRVDAEGRIMANFKSQGLKTQRLGAAQLQTGDTNVYLASQQVTDVTVYIANVSGNSDTYQLHVVPKGGSSGDDNIIIKARTLSAGEVDFFDELGLLPGEAIKGLTSVNDAMTVTVFGVPG